MFEQRGRGVNGLVSTQMVQRPTNRVFLERNILQSIFPVVNDATRTLDRRIKMAPASMEDQAVMLGPLKNALDREINSTAGMSRGAPVMRFFHDALKRTL